MKLLSAIGLLLVIAACGPPQDKFAAMMASSREGRNAQTLVLASELLRDPDQPALVKARTEMTVALVHIRVKEWKEARNALARAKALGLESDTGYFKDHLAEYEKWISEAH